MYGTREDVRDTILFGGTAFLLTTAGLFSYCAVKKIINQNTNKKLLPDEERGLTLS